MTKCINEVIASGLYRVHFVRKESRVWCGLCSENVIESGVWRWDVKSDNERHHEMWQTILRTEMNGLNESNHWFQRDRRTCHTAQLTINKLDCIILGRLILLRSGKVASPPFSWHLTLADSFLWGYVKDSVHQTALKIIYNVKHQMRQAIRAELRRIRETIVFHVCYRFNFLQ